MPSFGSIYNVRSGLFAQRRALEIIGQNIANANTVGYTRQEVSIAATESNQVINSTGRGVGSVDVLRYREEFLDRQFRSRAGNQGYADTRSNTLSQVESILGDLTENGLRTAMDDFFNAWQNLSLRPSDTSARYLIVQKAEHFLSVASSSFAELAQERLNIDQAISLKIADVNAAAQQLAEINRAIIAGGQNQQAAHELRDRRDMLVDSLAKLAGVTSTPNADGTITVHVGSLPLVDREFAYSVDATAAFELDMDPDPAIDSIQQYTTTYTWNGTSTPAIFNSGEIRALLEVRDQVIPEYMKYMDNLVRTVATTVNSLHTGGVSAPYTPTDIFTIPAAPARWMDVQINAAIKSDPTQILAGQGAIDPLTGLLVIGPGDGQRARSIAGIRDLAVMTGPPVGANTVKPGEYLRTFNTIIGQQVQQAESRATSAALQVEQAEKQRQSVTGVSLDDEMTKMITYQQAYNAAARMINTIDEALDVVINRMGLVGRA